MDQVATTSPFIYPAKARYKVCTRCEAEKPLSRFGVRKARNTKDKKSYYLAICKNCLSESAYEAHLVKKYGITQDEYDQMYEEQEGCCKLCDASGAKYLDSGRVRLHVDHHHDSGVIRGLLCNSCNWRVGMLEGITRKMLRKYLNYIDDL